MPSFQPARFLALCLVFLSVAGPGLCLAEGVGDFTALNERVSQIETEEAYALTTEALAARIAATSADLEQYIADNPQNVDALVLSVRLGYIKEVFVTARQTQHNDISIDPGTRFLALHERLDKALKLHPDYAAAYYWKAALYGAGTPSTDGSGRTQRRPDDLQKAIGYARQAVERDAKNGWYRQTLALYLDAAGEREQALEVLDVPAMVNNPIRRLLKEMLAFPVPPTAIFSQEDTDSYIGILMKQKVIKNFPRFRVQVFVVPMSVDKLADFFRETWPEFTFFSQGRDNMYGQYMLISGDGVRPSVDINEARAWASQNMGSVILSVQAIPEASMEQRTRTPAGRDLPAGLGKDISYLYYVNNRKVL